MYHLSMTRWSWCPLLNPKPQMESLFKWQPDVTAPRFIGSTSDLPNLLALEFLLRLQGKGECKLAHKYNNHAHSYLLTSRQK